MSRKARQIGARTHRPRQVATRNPDGTGAALEIPYGKNIVDVLDTSIEEAVELFADVAVARPVGILAELGLGYLTLGQSATTLSGGEAQRVELAAELSRVRRSGHLLYILDEPIPGLHLADIDRLVDALQRLVDAGNSVIVIEHHPDVIETADHVNRPGARGRLRRRPCGRRRDARADRTHEGVAHRALPRQPPPSHHVGKLTN